MVEATTQEKLVSGKIQMLTKQLNEEINTWDKMSPEHHVEVSQADTYTIGYAKPVPTIYSRCFVEVTDR